MHINACPELINETLTFIRNDGVEELQQLYHCMCLFKYVYLFTMPSILLHLLKYVSPEEGGEPYFTRELKLKHVYSLFDLNEESLKKLL